MKIAIGWLYPTLMSTYGDRGNVICLQRRCQWREIEVEIVPLKRETEVAEFDRVDLIVGGGAQDRQQEIVGVVMLGPEQLHRLLDEACVRRNLLGLRVELRI